MNSIWVTLVSGAKRMLLIIRHVNPFVARFSDGHATLRRKCVYQINYSSYTHKTTYILKCS